MKGDSAFRPKMPLLFLLVLYVPSFISFFVYLDDDLEGQGLQKVQYDRLIPAQRGAILDRNGLVMAEDRWSWDLIVNYLPQHRSVIKRLSNGDWTQEEARNRLRPISLASGLSLDVLWDALVINTSAAQVLRRGLGPAERQRIKAVLKGDLAYCGLSISQNFKRIYPAGAVNSHLLGLTGRDEEELTRIGISGLEKGLDKSLKGRDGESSAIGVGRGHGINPALTRLDSQSGASIKTTLDLELSSFARKEMVDLMDRHAPMHSLVIVVDVNNGDILTAQGLPDYDSNQPLESMKQVKSQDSEESIYLGWTFPGVWRLSPGSTFKPLVAALALEEKAITPRQIFSNYSGAYSLPGRVIHNSSKLNNHDMDFAEAIVHSSNIVFAQIGRKLGRNKMSEIFSAFGYDSQPEKLLGASLGFQSGKYPSKENFMRERSPDGMVFTIPSVAFGKEFEVPPLDHVMALSSLANGGTLFRPRLILDQPLEKGERVLSVNTCELIVDAMYKMVMHPPRTWLPHRDKFDYCGKSGTSQHKTGPAAGGYTSLFTAFGPKENPEILVLVAAFGTRGKKENYYGSRVCGPAAGNILYRALQLRGTLPFEDLDSLSGKDNLGY